jgi:hypothetical protein
MQYNLHCNKRLAIFPSPALFRPGRVWLVTYRLGTGKSQTFFYSVPSVVKYAICRLRTVNTFFALTTLSLYDFIFTFPLRIVTFDQITQKIAHSSEPAASAVVEIMVQKNL